MNVTKGLLFRALGAWSPGKIFIIGAVADPRLFAPDRPSSGYAEPMAALRWFLRHCGPFSNDDRSALAVSDDVFVPTAFSFVVVVPGLPPEPSIPIVLRRK